MVSPVAPSGVCSHGIRTWSMRWEPAGEDILCSSRGAIGYVKVNLRYDQVGRIHVEELILQKGTDHEIGSSSGIVPGVLCLPIMFVTAPSLFILP